MSKEILTGVHVNHCCIIHGCKYGDEDCPVERGKVKQAYLCEDCGGGFYEYGIPEHKCWEIINNRFIEMNKERQSEVFIVERLLDLNEGNGPMQIVKDSGYFTDEHEAWAFADTLTGVQGRKPMGGSWRREPYGDVRVKAIPKHDNAKIQKKMEIEKRIKELKQELMELEARYE